MAEQASAFLCADLNYRYLAGGAEEHLLRQESNCVNAFVVDSAESAQLKDIFRFRCASAYGAPMLPAARSVVPKWPRYRAWWSPGLRHRLKHSLF